MVRWNERVVHLDVVHVPRPDQQGIRSVRGTLVAVTAALDREALTVSLSCFHADFDGHAASIGRQRLIVAAARSLPDISVRRAVDPVAFKNVLLFISSTFQLFRRLYDL
jgi:hypothetical protein